MINLIPIVLITLVSARYWITHPMAKVNTRISKSDTRQRSSKQHLALRFLILRITNCPKQVFHSHLQCFEGEHIANRVRTLVCWAQNRVCWTGNTLTVWDSRIGFKSMAEHIQARRGVDSGRHGPCIERITDSKGWLERSVGNTGFNLFIGKVTGLSEKVRWWEQWNAQDCSTGGFAPGSGSGGDADQRT